LLTIFFAGLIGSVLQTLIIAAILIPKVLLISVAFMMAPFAYLPIFLIFEVSLILLLSFPFAGFSLDLETFCSALVPAFYRISSNDFNSNLESNFKAKVIRFLQLGDNVGYSVLLTVLVAVLVIILNDFDFGSHFDNLTLTDCFKNIPLYSPTNIKTL
jgi:hypothetical protein